nr:tripartite tricarboxylate transporter TctB family protein [Halomonas socia]
MSTNDQHIDPTLDLYSGAIFTAIGLGAMITARNYPLGSIDRMGPGFFPMVLGAIIATLGIMLIVKNLEGFRQARRRKHAAAPDPEVDSSRRVGMLRAARSMLFVLGGMTFFALTIEHIGLLLSVIGLVIICSFAETGMKWRSTLLLALFMAALSAAIFRYGIGLPLQLWGN